MATQFPFSFLESVFQNLIPPDLQPPIWLVQEVQRRLILLLNHVLMQEPEATARLVRKTGSVVLVQWRGFTLSLMATPAGLLDLAAPQAKPDLTLSITQESPLALLESTLRGDKPEVRIEGDVQLAAEVNWLVDHVRWDLEEDLSRLVGDGPAHTIGQAVRSLVPALREFAGTVLAQRAGRSPE